MRLFTGLALPGDVAGNLEGFLAKLRPAARIQWSPVSNLHVTTKFIGAWPEERLDDLKSALAGLRWEQPSRLPLSVQVRDAGFYPNAKSPRVFWCGIESPGLADLASATDRATSALGIESEKREYSPHLTLARIRGNPDLRALHEAIAAYGPLEFGRFEAGGFFLYLSKMSRSGSVYTKLAEFPLPNS